MKVRTLEPSELEFVGALLFQVFNRIAEQHGYRPPWTDEGTAAGLLSRYRRVEPDLVVVAEEGGAVIGVGAARVRGEVATIGPIAAYVEGHGVGGGIIEELISRAESAGAMATRLYVDGWNPSAYALYAGRGFAAIDNAMHLERKPGPVAALDSSRGLEVRPAEARDFDAIQRLDHRLTGHDRGDDLSRMVRLVARRRGDVVGFLGAQQVDGVTRLGPGAAVDGSDLVTLIAGALAAANGNPDGSTDAAADPTGIGGEDILEMRLSTAASAVSMAVLGLGFRVRELGVVMSRGALPPARPPQLYSIDPEIL